MRKSLLGLVALSGMLLATSCSQDDLSLSGGKGQLVFEVGVNNPMLTRAISDGSGANTLIYQVYQNGNAVGEQQTQNVTSYPTTVEINNLEVNASYTVVFWAQNSECDAYNTTDLKAITVDYTNAKDNDETRDAFYAALPVTVLGGDTPQQTGVILHRPFAQVNVGMTQQQLAGVTYTQSMMTLTGGVGDTFNALDGTSSGDVQEVTFALNPVVSETLSVGTPATTFEWLSMAYVLPGEGNVTASFVFEGTPSNATLDVPNVPLKTNYRTNILGNVQTGDVDIEVSQDPNFTGDNKINGELQSGGVIVSNFSYSYEDGTLKLSASYSGVEKEIDNAYFILTPGTASQSLPTRSTEIRLQADVNEQTKTLTYEGEQALDPGQYYAISVEITDVDDQTITLTPTGATAPGFTTPEEGSGDTDGAIVVTAQQFNALQLTSDDSAEEYQLSGVVTGIYNTTYGNFYLEDSTGRALIYGLNTASGGSFAETGVKEGDKITLRGHAKDYNGVNEIVNGTLVSIDEYAVEMGTVTVDTDGTSATFSVSYTNSHNTAITSSGFVYTIDGTSQTVQANASNGTMTATVTGLAYGSYTVYAYINSAQSKTVGFRLSDSSAGAEVTYTASYDKYGKDGPSNSYAGSATMNIDGIDWVLQGNSQINPWRLGGKGIENTDRALYTATPIPENISVISLQNGTATATVNSFKIVVASDADFTNVVDEFSYTFTPSQTVNANRPAGHNWSNCYFKVVYNVTCTGSSNQYVQMVQIELTGN